jgi:hypothetical protein
MKSCSTTTQMVPFFTITAKECQTEIHISLSKTGPYVKMLDQPCYILYLCKYVSQIKEKPTEQVSRIVPFHS